MSNPALFAIASVVAESKPPLTRTTAFFFCDMELLTFGLQNHVLVLAAISWIAVACGLPLNEWTIRREMVANSGAIEITLPLQIPLFRRLSRLLNEVFSAQSKSLRTSFGTRVRLSVRTLKTSNGSFRRPCRRRLFSHWEPLS